MKKISLILILGVCLTLIATIPANAQNYAKVTVYTNLRQDVDGVFRVYQVTGTNPGNLEWMGTFHFDRTEGGVTDGGYIYQGWVLLNGMAFSPGGTSFKMITSCYGQSRISNTYPAGSWPTYLEIPYFDFRTQGEE